VEFAWYQYYTLKEANEVVSVAVLAVVRQLKKTFHT
jgi:hypothetical protein